MRPLISKHHPSSPGSRPVALAWSLVVASAVVLAAGYEGMHEQVVLYRPPWLDKPILAPKSFVTVGRILWMGVGQLGAATVMWLASRDSPGWTRFWSWLGVTVGLKTLFECVNWVARAGSVLERAAMWLTVVVVAAFGAAAFGWWRRGDLQRRPFISSVARISLAFSLALWAAFAWAPLFGWR